MGEELSDEQKGNAVQFLTTEQFVLSSARASTIAESNGRLTIFLSTVSSVVVALAFIGQVSEIGTAFYVFALVLLPVVFFLGLVTFNRVLQLGTIDTVYMLGLNRIRHFYVEQAPSIRNYLILASNDDQGDTPIGMITNMQLQAFLTAAGTVEVINSVIVGIFVSLIVNLLVAPSIWASVGAGVVAFLLSVVVHHRYQMQAWNQLETQVTVHFPSQPPKQ